jgi:hypothetical protein
MCKSDPTVIKTGNTLSSLWTSTYR